MPRPVACHHHSQGPLEPFPIEQAFCFWSLSNHRGLLCCQNKLSETKSDHISPYLKSFRIPVVCRIKWVILSWESSSTRAQPSLLFHAGLWTIPDFSLGLSQLLLGTPPARLAVPPQCCWCCFLSITFLLFPFLYLHHCILILHAPNVLGVPPGEERNPSR